MGGSFFARARDWFHTSNIPILHHLLLALSEMFLSNRLMRMWSSTRTSKTYEPISVTVVSTSL